MNNSQLMVDSEPERSDGLEARLRAEETRLMRIIEALKGVEDSKEWSSLKIEVFDNLVNVLERELRTEAKSDEPNPLKLNRLSGELKWAERFSDLKKLENTYRVQLQNVRQQLHGKQSDR
jgi:predicted  nucleic acid-binding Zn-ribbon protein